jgi:hypothetical protein
MSNHTSALQTYDELFLFDFLAQYPQHQCGAPSTIDVGFLSIACILPYPVWAGMFAIVWYSEEFYFYLMRFVMMVMTAVLVTLQFALPRAPPIATCGPTHSWPCPQATLAAFGMSCLLRYSDDMRKQSDIKFLMGMLAVAFTLHAVLYLGFADPSSVVAGTIIGSVFAYIQHELMIVRRTWPKVLEWLQRGMEWASRRKFKESIGMVRDVIGGAGPSCAERVFVKSPYPVDVATTPLVRGRPVGAQTKEEEESDDDDNP